MQAASFPKATVLAQFRPHTGTRPRSGVMVASDADLPSNRWGQLETLAFDAAGRMHGTTRKGSLDGGETLGPGVIFTLDDY